MILEQINQYAFHSIDFSCMVTQVMQYCYVKELPVKVVGGGGGRPEQKMIVGGGGCTWVSIVGGGVKIILIVEGG